jgi:hypothetical protein
MLRSISAAGRKQVTGSKALKGSQHYPRGFGTFVGRLFKSAQKEIKVASDAHMLRAEWAYMSRIKAGVWGA